MPPSSNPIPSHPIPSHPDPTHPDPTHPDPFLRRGTNVHTPPGTRARRGCPAFPGRRQVHDHDPRRPRWRHLLPRPCPPRPGTRRPRPGPSQCHTVAAPTPTPTPTTPTPSRDHCQRQRPSSSVTRVSSRSSSWGTISRHDRVGPCRTPSRGLAVPIPVHTRGGSGSRTAGRRCHHPVLWCRRRARVSCGQRTGPVAWWEWWWPWWWWWCCCCSPKPAPCLQQSVVAAHRSTARSSCVGGVVQGHHGARPQHQPHCVHASPRPPRHDATPALLCRSVRSIHRSSWWCWWWSWWSWQCAALALIIPIPHPIPFLVASGARPPRGR